MMSFDIYQNLELADSKELFRSDANMERYGLISSPPDPEGNPDGSGDDGERAFELASLNLANRPTLRAFEQAYEIAVAAGQPERVSEILGAAKNLWGTTNTFRFSPLAECRVELVKNDSEQ